MQGSGVPADQPAPESPHTQRQACATIATQFQEFLTAFKGVGQFNARFCDDWFVGVVFGNDKATADGVVNAFMQCVAVTVGCVESQAIGVPRQRIPFLKDGHRNSWI